jgi:hypothetical protein
MASVILKDVKKATVKELYWHFHRHRNLNAYDVESYDKPKHRRAEGGGLIKPNRAEEDVQAQADKWCWLKRRCIGAILRGESTLDLEKLGLGDRVYAIDEGKNDFTHWLCNNEITAYQDLGVNDILFSVEYAQSFSDWIDDLP